MPKRKSKREKELIEMAAEQFARLFWKQWYLEQGSRKFKSRNHKKFRDLYNQGIVER